MHHCSSFSQRSRILAMGCSESKDDPAKRGSREDKGTASPASVRSTSKKLDGDQGLPRTSESEPTSQPSSHRSSVSAAASNNEAQIQLRNRESIQDLEEDLRLHRVADHQQLGTTANTPPQQGRTAESIEHVSLPSLRHSSGTTLGSKPGTTSRRDSEDTFHEAARNKSSGAKQTPLSPNDMNRSASDIGTMTSPTKALLMSPGALARSEKRESHTVRVQPSTPFDQGLKSTNSIPGKRVQTYEELRLQEELDQERRATQQGEFCHERENPIWWQELLERNRKLAEKSGSMTAQTLSTHSPPPKVPLSLQQKMQTWMTEFDSSPPSEIPEVISSPSTSQGLPPKHVVEQLPGQPEP